MPTRGGCRRRSAPRCRRAERHRQRVQAEQRSCPACPAPQEERYQQCVRGMEGRDRSDRVRVLEPRSNRPLTRRRRTARGRRWGRSARRPLELAFAAREPWREGGEERERREPHRREQRHPGDVPPKPRARRTTAPGDGGRSPRSSSCRRPRRRSRTSAAATTVPEPMLQPDGGNGAGEEDRSASICGLRPRRATVREAAQQVVRPEHERERQPLEEDAAEPAAEIRRRERQQPEHDPHEQPLARDGHAVAPHERAQRRDVRGRRGPAQPRSTS